MYWIIVASAAGVLFFSGGIRNTFGLFLRPMSESMGWGREVLSLSVALYTLVMGVGSPFMGALADKYGTGRVIVFGGLMWGLGVVAMAYAATPLAMVLTTGIVVGLGAAATSVSVTLGAVGRKVEPARRSTALGLATAGTSLGQMALLPVAQALIGVLGWNSALIALGLVMTLLVPLAWGLADAPAPHDTATEAGSMGAALSEAGNHRGFWLLTAGFFVCGFHVSFVAVHLPAFVVDQGLSAEVGITALLLVGFFNLFGATFWGRLGGSYSKPFLLSGIYALRAVLFTVVLFMPMTVYTVLAFASGVGFLWLGTVPLTSGLVGQIFGVRYLSTLFGIVFLGHQMGGFLGAWLGGWVYDVTQSYDLMWYGALGLGVFAALIHLPINAQAVKRAAPAPAAT